MSNNYNIEELRMMMELIEKNKDQLTEDQRDKLKESDLNIDEVEAAFKEYDALVKDMPNQINKAFNSFK
jgi:hypothetical protein